MAVVRNPVRLSWTVLLVKDLADRTEQQVFGCPALRGNECIRPAQLVRPAVDETALVLGQIELVHQLLDIFFAGEDQLQGFTGGISPLKSIPNGIQQHVVAFVPAIRLITVE